MDDGNEAAMYGLRWCHWKEFRWYTLGLDVCE